MAKKLVLVGAGQVGREVLRLADVTREIEVAAIVDSRGLLRAAERGGSLPWDVVERARRKKETGADLSTVESSSTVIYESGRERVSTLVGQGGDLAGSVVADCTASESSIDIVKASLKAGGGAALANKRPVGSSLDNYRDLLKAGKGGRLRYESACGAGTPMVATAERILAGGDELHFARGALSGTLGVVCDGLREGKSLAQVVREAKEGGLTEPDPRDDLSGADVKRKAVVVARAAGIELEGSDVTVEQLYPAHLGPEKLGDADEFLAQLEKEREFLEELTERVKAAEGRGKVVKHCATIDAKRRSARVGLEEVDRDSPLGSIRGPANLVEFHTAFHGDCSLAVQGAGAGPSITASGVLADALQASYCVPSL